MKIGIVGSGLGGLLAGVSLLKKGHEVEVFESLPYPGGRFTNLEYKGFQLSTGALHMIPHGEKGPLGRMLKDLGIGLEIFPSKPEGYFRINGEDYLFDELKNLFPFMDRIRISMILALLKFGSGGKESYREWLLRWTKNPLILQISDSFCGWALSLDSSQIPSRELIAITKNINKLGGPGIPKGGCKGVTGTLAEELENLGGKLLLKTKVKRIRVKDGRVTGISAKEKRDFDIVISNVGPRATIDLCGRENFSPDYLRAMTSAREAAGIKISIACNKAMLGHSGILFTPQAKRIDGLNEVTNADPTLAPEGKHLMMSHQSLNPSQHIKREIELGIKDLHALFPDFKRHCEILMIQTYRSNWPVNRARSGEHIDPISPVKGLYYVGDAIKPEGWMETEGVAAGVEMALEGL